MAAPSKIVAVFFIYRSRLDHPLGKVVRRLPDATVLDWFRRGWRTEDPEEWIYSELGEDVYGLESVFEAADEHDLPEPLTWQELYATLDEHLNVEGDPYDHIRLDANSLRIKTDDDEADLAYMFVDDATVAAAPQRWAYPLQNWPLPSNWVAGEGAGWMRAILLNPGMNSEHVTVPGMRLPELYEVPKNWPAELRAATETALGPAPPAGESRVEVGEHLTQAALYIDSFWGHRQLFLFDDLWAAAHPDLVTSLMGYVAHWDPEHDVVRVSADPEVLTAAVERLYEVFAAYDLPASTDPCPRCVADADKCGLHDKPLRALTADDLRHYASGTLYTGGGETEFKHFLPRIMEIAVDDRSGFADLEGLYRRLAHAEFRGWPLPEADAVLSFARAHWGAALYRRTPGGAATALACMMFIEPDVRPYLRAWQDLRTEESLLDLAEFVDDNHAEIVERGRLANAHLESDCPAGQRQVIGWLTGETLTTAMHVDLADPLRIAVFDRLRALNASLAASHSGK